MALMDSAAHAQADAQHGQRIRVGMIVGDNHTRHCGVKDGARILVKALAPLGVDVSVLAPDAWRPGGVLQFVRTLKREKYDILHIQYPSIGYRGTLVPHVLGLFSSARGSVVTLHEFSGLPKLQQLSTHIFRLSAGTLLFGSEYERSKFNTRLGVLGGKQATFPILSQVPAVPSPVRDATVVYFGQIRPKKGLEAYLDLAHLSIQAVTPYDFRVLGSISSAHLEYAAALQAKSLPQVRWSVDLTFDEVGSILGRSFAAYLPFPDGASDRRGSLLAAMLNGLPVLSRIGPATTPSLCDLILPVATPEEARSALDELRASPGEWDRRSRASREYAQKHSWEEVAKRHADTYRTLLQAR